MARTREENNAIVDEIAAVFEEANSIYLVSLTGLTSNEINSLRADLRKSGTMMRVVKNRLARRAASGRAAEKLDESFRGPTAMVYHREEPISAAKGLVAFAKDHPNLELRAGLIEGRDVVDSAGIEAVSKLPGLDDTRAMILSAINGPATMLARLLNTPATQLARVVDEAGKAGALGNE